MTETFQGFEDNVEYMPTPPPVPENQPDVPGKRRKVSNLQAAREQKERMAEIEEIADAFDFDAQPEWSQQAEELEAGGWRHETRQGQRIWIHPDHGDWKGEDVAYYILVNTPPKP